MIAVERLGILLVSLNLTTGKGYTAANVQHLALLGQVLLATGRCIIIGGDFYLDRQFLIDSGWLQAIDAVVTGAPADQATCVQGDSQSSLGYAL